MNWNKDYDENSNTFWEAASPYGNDQDGPFYWRLKQKLENDEIVWYEAHDKDILDEDDAPVHFPTLDEAMEYVETEHRRILAYNNL